MSRVPMALAVIAFACAVALLCASGLILMDTSSRDRQMRACASVAETNDQWLRCTKDWR